MVIKMNMKSKILIIGLVTFLVIVGLNSAFVNAIDLSFIGGFGSSDSEVSDLVDPVVPEVFTPAEPKLVFNTPNTGQELLEPAPFENDYIEIYITDGNGNPFPDVDIFIFKNHNQKVWVDFTNANGKTSWPTPNVGSNTEYKIEARKDGYTSVSVVITIVNRALTVITDPSVVEGNKFVVEVTDQFGDPVNLASVEFNGVTKQTGSTGKVSFTAPYINGDDSVGFNIIASAPWRGYDEATTTINVESDGQVPTECLIYGQIRDYDFNVIEDTVEITVTLADGAYSVDSNDGGYEIKVTPRPEGEYVTVTASCPGYPAQSVKRWIIGGTQNNDHGEEQSTMGKFNFWLIEGNDPANQGSQQTTQGTNSNNI
jgi:hypothetical protein